MTPDDWAQLHGAANGAAQAWSAGDFAGLMDSAGVLSLGDGRAALLGRVIADEAEVLMLATHPDHRRQGLARAVLAAFEAGAAAQGAERVFLDVRADNRAALGLYATAGYAETGRRARYYRMADGARVDAILLAKALTQRPPDAAGKESG
ncbi:GNAT family N-acetyltransferase [Pseudaestuariivita atlantica]|uniref:N-acetyltransferase domain-containing protein n=1 Tax=Pseudaestuariivita atlantica TaxID=1317121 RepID=A0A0L1JRC6_9RHOB|nr:GNAT family N-acetyltransferase [Pseudaestuariivita atlantica]KNG94354.1 hypothetical protein ATO11_09175 [Pseudaestuariivita atlantica]